MKTILSMVSVMVIILAMITFNLVSCSGAGGGGGVEGDVEEPPPSGTASGADNVPVFWLYYSNGWGESTSVQETSDHGFIVSGSRPNASDTGQVTFFAKTDSLGVVTWEKTLTGLNEKINSIRQTTDGGYIMAERIDNDICLPSKTCLSLVRTSATGTVLWRNATVTSSLGGGAPGGGAYAARQVADGFVMVGSGKDQYVTIVKTDQNGTTSWVCSLPTPSHNGWEVGFDVEQTADGGFIIAGVYNGANGAELGLFKTDASGVLQWNTHYGPGEAYAVRQTADGYVLAGRTAMRTFGGSDPADAIIIKTDLNGNEVWRRTFGGTEDDEAHSVTLSQDGGYVLTGTTRSFGGTVTQSEAYLWDDMYLIKLDRDGKTVWQKVKGVRAPGNDHGNEIATVSDGGFIVAGASGAMAMLAKFDKNGDTVNLGDRDLTITVPDVSGIIKSTNAVEVAAAGAIGINDPHDVGANSLDLLIAKLKNALVSDYCSSGSYSFSPDPSPSISTATPYMLTFTDCVSSAVTQTLNGSAIITIDSMSAGSELITDTYSVQATLSSLTIAITESGTLSSTITGGMRFSRTATNGDFVELAQSIDSPATKLTISETEGTTTRTRVLGPFSLHDSVTTGSYSYGAVNDTFTVVDTAPSVATVSFAGTVLVPVQGTGLGNAPSSGSFQMIASDNSKLTATITNGVAAIAIDTNADGAIDGTISAAWDVLN